MPQQWRQDATSDSKLTPDTVLRIAPDLRFRFGEIGQLLVDLPTGAVVDAGPDGFAVLSVFTEPTPLGDAIDELERRTGTGFVRAMGVVNALLEEGSLIAGPVADAAVAGWAHPAEHARMLHDDRRTSDYLRAIERAVRPGDVVLEIGTGSGVLAVAAARAGARQVYAIEASDIADVAQRVFEVNGVADRVTLIRGWSRHVDLPEPADVLVSEIIGSEPLEEEILETTLDARQRLLAPGARLLPHTLTLEVRPVVVPEPALRQRAIPPGSRQRWQSLYGVDFEPLIAAAEGGLIHHTVESEVASQWRQVGAVADLVVLDLARISSASVSATCDVVGAEPFNAVAMTFRAGLSGPVSHTLDPWRWPVSSWSTSVWILPEPALSQAARVTYRRRVPEYPDGLECRTIDQAMSPVSGDSLPEGSALP